MSNWSETQLTAKGRALDAKVTAGLTTLTFTRMKIGSGNVTPEEIDTMTDLKSPRLVIGISSCEVSEADPTICSVIGVAKSDDVETSFLVKEQGLFATDPDDGEILYAVMIDSEPDKMPNKNVPSPLSIMYQINIVSDNAADITAIIDPAGLVTVQTMNAAINSHDSNATAHGAAISAHNADTSAHKNLYGFFLRQPSKYYALGTVVYLPSIGAGLYLECTTAGTTDSGDLVISTPTPNDTVTDGTVTWTIRNIKSKSDSFDVGDLKFIAHNDTIPSGWLLCDGSAVSRTTYAELFAAIGTTYGVGDGTTTFNLPNFIGRVVQGAAVAGTYKEAGLPNIEGEFNSSSRIATTPNGCITDYTVVKTDDYGGGGAYFSTATNHISANGSNPIYGNSDTVQPPALTCRVLIKYE